MTTDTIGDVERDDLDGHTMDELSDYLDAGRSPRDPSIEDSPGCRRALSTLARLRAAAWALLEAKAQEERDHDDPWMSRVIGGVRRQALARFGQLDLTGTAARSEGAVRWLIRTAVDETGRALVGRCAVVGDLDRAGGPIIVRVSISAAWGEGLPELAGSMRLAILEALGRHTELNIVSVEISIDDIHILS